jgi:multidrug efflux system membrane fusion protein
MLTNRKRLTAALGALAVVSAVAGIGFTHGTTSGPLSAAQAADAPPATQVDVAVVLSQTITDWQSYSGRLEAIDHVEVRPLVAGTIIAVHFRDGARVKKGDPLFTIDPRPYQAEVDRAAAQVAAAKARAIYTATDAARADRLLADNAIAKRDYDEKQNASREAAAGVKAAEAALEAAQVNLGYTRITAPVTGRVSRAELTVGNVVSIGSSAPVSLGLANEDGYSRKGAVTSVDNRLDTSSGTIRVRATLDNADGALVPGLFARVKVGGGAPHPAILIDDAAVGTDQAKKFVLVVDRENKVVYREVQLGGLHDNLRVVTSGLKDGERIVVNGMMHAKPSDTVSPHMVNMADAAKSAA